MSNPQPKRSQEFQDVALTLAAKQFAKFLGLDNVPVVWNQNPYRIMTKEGIKRQSYPLIYIKYRSIKRSDWAGKTKHHNAPALGAMVDGGTTRTSLKMTPVTIDLEFMVITDNPSEATRFSGLLLVGNEDFDHRKHLAFAISNNKLGPNFNVTNQLVLTSEQYDIQDIEFDENTPMEYNVVGTMQLHTRATLGGLDPNLLPTFAVYSNINPDQAVMNSDNTTSGLEFNENTQEHLPVAIRDSQGFNT